MLTTTAPKINKHPVIQHIILTLLFPSQVHHTDFIGRFFKLSNIQVFLYFFYESRSFLSLFLNPNIKQIMFLVKNVHVSKLFLKVKC